MFNRVLQVRLIKNATAKNTTPDVKETESEGKTAIIAASLIHGIRIVVAGVGAYVVLDTVRQVLVAQATKV